MRIDVSSYLREIKNFSILITLTNRVLGSNNNRKMTHDKWNDGVWTQRKIRKKMPISVGCDYYYFIIQCPYHRNRPYNKNVTSEVHLLLFKWNANFLLCVAPLRCNNSSVWEKNILMKHRNQHFQKKISGYCVSARFKPIVN